jgi:CBS domain-containing protein
MSKTETTLAIDASIIETVFRMIQGGKRYYSIVSDRKLVGIVTAMDVFKKVLKA